jgi:hypothetical protein
MRRRFPTPLEGPAPARSLIGAGGAPGDWVCSSACTACHCRMDTDRFVLASYTLSRPLNTKSHPLSDPRATGPSTLRRPALHAALRSNTPGRSRWPASCVPPPGSSCNIGIVAGSERRYCSTLAPREQTQARTSPSCFLLFAPFCHLSSSDPPIPSCLYPMAARHPG